MDIESIHHEERIFYPPKNVIEKANVSGMEAYKSICKKFDENYEEAWADLARELLIWEKPFTRILNEDNPPFFKWFEDGELNASYNCLDRHLNTQPNKTAIIFEADDGTVKKISYKELYHRVCEFANGLKTLNMALGDRVIIYLPMTIEAVVAMQACARIGLTHSVVFGGFSSKSIQERVVDAKASLIITADFQFRGGKQIPLKSAVDEAIAMGGCESVKHVITLQRGKDEILLSENDILWSNLIRNQKDECDPIYVGAEHPLFILYTSGSTGTPKGVQHATAGYLLHAMNSSRWTFDMQDEDIYWCTADVGWITGHTYVAYGPIAMGVTQVIFEGIPTFPDASRFWKIIEKHKVSIFYTAPTAIRALIKAGEVDPTTGPSNSDISSLRLLGTVGEPINPEAWMWYYTAIGKEKCPIVDTFWQTETGGHVITPLPGVTPLVPGSCTLPFPGIAIDVVDETGADVAWGNGGLLVIKKPWPSMIRTIWGDPERFKKSYFPEDIGGNLYLAGDGAVRDKDTGYFTIMGRIDDVLNISGHRLGTQEIESALVSSEYVAEAAVVGRPHDVKGEAIVAFVVLKAERPSQEDAKEITTALREWVAKEIGPIAKPDEIRFGDNLPKTRSGKIMRRLLRSIAKGEEITADISTLENPAILDQLREKL
ncbi:acetate--CoA ligase [Methylophilaceae bacterium]|jgi:acetyl-CoA synthetase|nr:MAG: AMP-dependent synthetase [Methylophilales bacterium BACL14 MAG-120910-bin43]KRP07535.1 MAG: AMP-dependent synthetase [Methylophilales bacterium BACL14 MAG-120920-bin58]MDA7700343.1 acetate--CoA ligase [Methylophilaceae bacterium]|tara:strand:- start:9187 stop:11160 length:1974 start_codon:yes stop_codon:yes gene_type:complete